MSNDKCSCIESRYLEKNAHYPIAMLVLMFLLYIFEAKKRGKKKSLNTLSLAADLLKVIEGPSQLSRN